VCSNTVSLYRFQKHVPKTIGQKGASFGNLV